MTRRGGDRLGYVDAAAQQRNGGWPGCGAARGATGDEGHGSGGAWGEWSHAIDSQRECAMGANTRGVRQRRHTVGGGVGGGRGWRILTNNRGNIFQNHGVLLKQGCV